VKQQALSKRAMLRMPGAAAAAAAAGQHGGTEAAASAAAGVADGNLLDSATGAFVHGVEDDVVQVGADVALCFQQRTASLCKQAVASNSSSSRVELNGVEYATAQHSMLAQHEVSRWLNMPAVKGMVQLNVKLHRWRIAWQPRIAVQCML
jgi:hypothetical protein